MATSYVDSWRKYYNQSGGDSLYANKMANASVYGNSAGPTSQGQINSALSGTKFTQADVTPNSLSSALSSGLTAPATYQAGTKPVTMDFAEAMARAKANINPQYDTLRGRTEQAHSAQREQIPQLLAARYGMSGTRGGRRQSQEYGATQRENQAITDLENSRQMALNAAAESYMNNDYKQKMGDYQLQESLKQQEAASAWDAYKQQVLEQANKEQNEYSRMLQQLLFDREDKQNEQTQSNWDKTFDYNQTRNARADDLNERNILANILGIDPVTGKDTLEKVIADRNYGLSVSKARSGGGGSGGSGGAKPTSAKPTYGQMAQGVASLVDSLKQPTPVSPSENVSKMLPGYIPPLTSTKSPEQVFNSAASQILSQAGIAGLSATEINNLVDLAAKYSGAQPWFKPASTTW